MSKWLRLDADAIRHRKLVGLPANTKWLWIELLCVAAENGGILPHERHLSKLLGMRVDHLLRAMYELVKSGLIDVIDGGYRPHDWDDYQMKSYSSVERTRKWRQKCDVTVTRSTITNTNTKENTSLRDVKEKPKKRVLKRSQITEQHEPDDNEVGIATGAGMSALTLDLEWHRFRAHHMAKGSLMANWTQAWVTWVTNWKTFGSKQVQSGGNGYEGRRKEGWRPH
jgi:hypothetical protein